MSLQCANQLSRPWSKKQALIFATQCSLKKSPIPGRIDNYFVFFLRGFMVGIVTSRSLHAVIAFGLLAAGSVLHAQGIFRVMAIPDASPTEQARRAVPLMKFLGKKSWA